MPTFESIYELEKFINNNLEAAMDDLSKEISKDLKKNYKDLWYHKSPKSPLYKRTNQFLKGIDIHRFVFDDTQNKTFEYEIGFYGTRIAAKLDKKRLYNAYMSVDGSIEYGGIPITEAIAWWVEKGTSSPLYSIPSKNVFQITAKKYNRDKVETKIKNSLKRRGIGFI